MKKLPFCSIIVLNYNGKEHLTDCFNSIKDVNYPKDRIEVIMVDNGSKDDSVKFVKKKFPWIKILKLDKNYGFAEGNNKGIEIAKGEYLLILNNDTKVDKNWLIELVKIAMSDKNIAACGSKILDFYRPKIIQYAGAYLDIIGSPYHRGLGEKDNGQYDKIEEVFYALDCSMLIKKEAIDKLNHCYDPEFFVFYEETDLSWRLKYLGYKIMYVPTSIVYHKGGATASKAGNILTYYLYRNKIWTFKKNLRTPLRQLILFLVSFRMFIVIFYRILSGKWNYGIHVFKFLFIKKKSDVDLSKIPLKKQLSFLSLPILSKYSQYFSQQKLLEKK